MKTKIPLAAALCGLFIAAGCDSFAYERAYDKTEPGTVEVKKIPPAKILLAREEGTYFKQADDLFMRLFRYLKKHDVAMTIPVESRIQEAQMVFYLGEKDAARPLSSEGEVEVIHKPARLVASLGARGSYSESNFEKTKKNLLKWLIEQKEYEPAGAPYAVYWNGPFMPAFMKRFEVHIPIQPVEPSGDQPAGVAQV